MATHEVTDEELSQYIDSVTKKFFPRSIVVRFTFYCTELVAMRVHTHVGMCAGPSRRVCVRVNNCCASVTIKWVSLECF